VKVSLKISMLGILIIRAVLITSPFEIRMHCAVVLGFKLNKLLALQSYLTGPLSPRYFLTVPGWLPAANVRKQIKFPITKMGRFSSGISAAT